MKGKRFMEYKEIKKLMDEMGNSKLTEMEIEFQDGIKIKMKKDYAKYSNNTISSYASF